MQDPVPVLKEILKVLKEMRLEFRLMKENDN